jgi:hypothetical protein
VWNFPMNSILRKPKSIWVVNEWAKPPLQITVSMNFHFFPVRCAPGSHLSRRPSLSTFFPDPALSPSHIYWGSKLDTGSAQKWNIFRWITRIRSNEQHVGRYDKNNCKNIPRDVYTQYATIKSLDWHCYNNIISFIEN